MRRRKESARPCLVGVHQVNLLADKDAPQQPKRAKDGGQRVGAEEGQARRIVDLRSTLYSVVNCSCGGRGMLQRSARWANRRVAGGRAGGSRRAALPAVALPRSAGASRRAP